MRLPQAEAGPAAARRRGAWRGSPPQLHGRRPLARHRGRRRGGLPDHPDRGRLRRAHADASAGPCVRLARRGGRLDPVEEGKAVTRLADLKVKIFADGADKAVMLDMYAMPHIKGLTTNPTLMAKAGICDYEGFARDVLQHIIDKPLSLEVFSDEIEEMEREALKVSSWGPNVYVKIPITNTRGESTCGLVRRLAGRG